MKPANLKGNHPGILIGRTDADPPVFWLPDANSGIVGKVPDSGKDWGQKEKTVSEDEMSGWHHQCNIHELGQISGIGGYREAWGAAVHGVTESDRTRWLNNNNTNIRQITPKSKNSLK